MNKIIIRSLGAVLVLLWFPAMLALPSAVFAAAEKTFEVMQVGTNTYKNVTVTTQSKAYVIIRHSAGMVSVKVSDLPAVVRQKLGLEAGSDLSAGSNIVEARGNGSESAAPVSPEPSGGEPSKIGFGPKLPGDLPLPGKAALAGAFVVLLLFYLFFCYCCRLICLKADEDPGWQIWVPVFQMGPMFKAAGMSPWWLLGYLIPVVNVVVMIMWCFKIAAARGKSFMVGILLLFPVVSIFAFLYLAFADPLPDAEERKPGGGIPKITPLKQAA